METDRTSVLLKSVNIFISYLGLKFLRKMEEPDLSDKIVVINGACSDIGEALAKNFFARGCLLILVGIDDAKLQDIKKSVLSVKSTCSSHCPVLVPFDSSELENIQMCVEKIFNVYGRIDILVNNANINFVGEVLNTSLCTDIEIMKINYFSQMTFTKAVLNHMINNSSGHVIFISSSQGICTDPLYSAFGASQHALLSFANSIRDEIQDNNIKISTICLPKMYSYSHTSMSEHSMFNKQPHPNNKGMPNKTALEVISAIKNEQNEIIVEPFYRKLSFFIKEMWPNIHFKLFRSKF